MALVPRSGSLPQESLPSDTTPVDRADAFEQIAPVRNVMVERDAFVATDYPSDNALIAGYLDGSRITVTYYHVYSDGLNSRSSITDITARRDNIDIPLMKITNFELTVPEGFVLDYDPETNESTVGGSALVYPGFSPFVGDGFLYGLSGGRVGLFVVTGANPLSYFNERTHRIDFQLKSIIDTELQALLEDRVKKAYVFDKAVYLGGNKTLLTEDSYAYHRTLVQMKGVLTEYYYRVFYSETLGTLVRPDGVYDPYVVEYLNAIVSFADVRTRLRQLYTRADEFFDYTLWSRLLNAYNLKMNDLVHVYDIRASTHAYTDVSVTALVNRNFIKLRPDLKDVAAENWPAVPTEVVADGYVLSPAFYLGTVDSMSAFEVIVRQAITQRQLLDVPGFIATHLDTYSAGTKEEQFYKIPLMLRLIDLAIRGLVPASR